MTDLPAEMSALRFSAAATLAQLRQAIVESGDPDGIVDLAQQYLAGTERLAAIDLARAEVDRISEVGYTLTPTQSTHAAAIPAITGDAGVALPGRGSEAHA